ncbi:MAG: TRAP transporter permease [Bacillota bacterium]|nr:TRAP transporter permease [Bacillota bacterium]
MSNPSKDKIIKIIAIVFALFYFYSAGFGIISTESNRGLFLLFVNSLCLLLYPANKKKADSKVLAVIDLLVLILGSASIIYWINQYSKYCQFRSGMPNQWDLLFGVILVIVSLEVTRRVTGNVLMVLGFVFVVQLYLGPYLPGIFAHKGFTISRIIEFNFSTMEGIFGTIASVFATYVMPFLIFGAFLNKTGGGEFFIDLARALAGRISGGPALIAVGGSCLFGSISGSPVANVVATGSFTIPMMKRVGFKPEFAAAVEAAASTGGQFMPPVMGAGAFILATVTETPYSKIVIMAIVPALLYYISLISMVYFNARKNGLQGLKKEELPKASEVFRKGWYFSFAVVIAIVLIMSGYSPALTAFWTTIFLIVCALVRKENRFTMNDFIEALNEAARSSLVVGATAGTLGLVMGGITLSGLGVKFSAMILALSHGNLILNIILISLVATIIGMGLPTTASYIVLSILAAPSLIHLGVAPVQAHLACFWLSMASNITPPVCVAAFAGASLADAEPMKTGFAAFRLGMYLYIMPFVFVYLPQLLLIGAIGDILEILIAHLIATFTFSAAMQGWLFRKLNVIERLVFAAITAMLFVPSIMVDLIAVGILIVIAASLYRKTHTSITV